MKNKIAGLLTVLHLISVCSEANPCLSYASLDMADGRRSSDFYSRNSQISICDSSLDAATWYRFEQDAGNRLIERPVAPWYCGTQAPIWMNGTHPTDRSEVTAGVCATYSSGNICGWRGTIRIRLCNESGSEYFVYQLAVPPGCPLAYCVDAASRKHCTLPLVWLDDEFRCGVSVTTTKYSTVQPTTTSRSISERQTLAPTLTPSTEPTFFGWGPWGPWTVCSKPCDYGYQSRRRTCGQLPCEGPANTYQRCNQYNCQKPFEKTTNGITVIYHSPSSDKDTLLTVVQNQARIQEIIRRNINDICSQNVSMCCGSRYNPNRICSSRQEFVRTDDIYPAQGSIDPKTDNTVSYRVIASVNEDVDRVICNGQPQRNHRRQSESNPNFVSFDVMLMAAVQSVDSVFKETGLIMTANRDQTVIDVPGTSCLRLTCALPIALCIAAVVASAIFIGVFCFAKNKPKSKTEPVTSPPEPPQYYEVLSADLSANGYAVDIISQSEYEEYEKVDQESKDYEKPQFDAKLQRYM